MNIRTDYSDEELDKMLDGFIDKWKEEDIKKRHLFLDKGNTIFAVIDKKKSIMDDDNAYSENKTLLEIDKIVEAVATICLYYCKSINKDISTNEYFLTYR